MQQSSMPSISFSILEYKNNDQLNTLMESDSALSDLAKDIHFIKSLEEEKTEVMMTNLSLAEYNLSQEPRLEGAKHKLALAFERANMYKEEIAVNKPKLEILSNKYSLDVILALLQTEAAKNEETCEELTSKFLNGNKEIDDFIEDYLFMRQKYYTKKIKAEKLQDLMLKKSTPPTYNPNYAPSPQTQYGAGISQSPSYSQAYPAENLQTQMLKNTTPTTTHSSPYNPNYPPSPQTKWGSGISRSTSNSPAYPEYPNLR